jgi:hypothetical protein
VMGTRQKGHGVVGGVDEVPGARLSAIAATAYAGCAHECCQRCRHGLHSGWPHGWQRTDGAWSMQMGHTLEDAEGA